MSKLRFLYVASMLLCSLTLMACGQSGPLYLPPEETKQQHDS